MFQTNSKGHKEIIHVLEPSFGINVQYFDWLVDVAIRMREAKLKGITKQLFLSELYSETFRINSCGPADSPLAMYQVSSVTGLRSLLPLKRRLHDFMLYEVGKHMNMSFNEFISLPRDMVVEILSTLKVRIDKANAEAERLKNRIKKGKPEGEPDHDLYRSTR